ncbi:integrating conjugative element protein [Pasteurella multocida]|uniref:integrating conjugative element protein n=1 Tax=Pasteurella multocida TaxID=747 RepID=UPI00397ACA10
MNKVVAGLIGLVSLVSFPAHAELRVVADLGGESAVRFYEPIQPIIDETSPAPSIPSVLSEADLLPIVSHFMTPGAVEAHKFEFNLPGMLPIFLVGEDVLSQQWLSTNRDKLLQMQAMGMVVHVSNLESLNRLRQIAGQLPLMPVSGDDLAQRLHLTHYPILIDSRGFHQ